MPVATSSATSLTAPSSRTSVRTMPRPISGTRALASPSPTAGSLHYAKPLIADAGERHASDTDLELCDQPDRRQERRHRQAVAREAAGFKVKIHGIDPLTTTAPSSTTI